MSEQFYRVCWRDYPKGKVGREDHATPIDWATITMEMFKNLEAELEQGCSDYWLEPVDE